MFKKILVTAQLALMSVVAFALPTQPVTLPQTISGFAPASPLNYSAGLAFGLSATGGNSGNPGTFSSNSPSVCTVSGSAASVLAAGTCSVFANQAGKQLNASTT